MGRHFERERSNCANRRSRYTSDAFGRPVSQESQSWCFPRSDLVSKRGMVRKICGALQTFLAVLPDSFFPALLVRSPLDPAEFLHYPNSSSSKKIQIQIKKKIVFRAVEKAHHQQETTFKSSFDAFTTGDDGKKERHQAEKVGDSPSPQLPKTCHEKVWICVIGSPAHMHHPLFHSPPSFFFFYSCIKTR